MLIPFPAPPALRKVPDHIFPHLAAAVDPPEVVVDLRQQFFGRGKNGNSNGAVLLSLNAVTRDLSEDEVRFLYSGVFQTMPARDAFGRLVVVLSGRIATLDVPIENLVS